MFESSDPHTQGQELSVAAVAICVSLQTGAPLGWGVVGKVGSSAFSTSAFQGSISLLRHRQATWELSGGPSEEYGIPSLAARMTGKHSSSPEGLGTY